MGLTGWFLGRVYLLVQGLNTLTQLPAGPGLTTDLDPTPHFFRVPKALIHIGPKLPLPMVVTGNGPPGRMDGLLSQRPEMQQGLQHGLLLGHPHRQTMLTQECGEAGQTHRRR